MNLQISDEFADLLKGMSTQETWTTRMFELLEWAHQNPPKASLLANEAAKLNPTSKREFARLLLHYCWAPEDALKRANDAQEEHRKMRSTISKALAKIRRHESFALTMPNGVVCNVGQSVNGNYQFMFLVHEKKVLVSYRRKLPLGWALDEVKRGDIYRYYIEFIAFDGKTLKDDNDTTKAILNAVANNIDPHVSLLMA